MTTWRHGRKAHHARVHTQDPNSDVMEVGQDVQLNNSRGPLTNSCRKKTEMAPADVRYGSLADILTSPHHVRSSPQSRHSLARVARPLCAKSRHPAVSASFAKSTAVRPRCVVRKFLGVC